MNQHSESKTPEQIIEAIFALDLAPIKFKLMDKREGQGWSREKVDHYELEYKRFLGLLVKYPDAPIAPNTNVDKFWHGHILDTMKYADDCEKVFGYFLHHYPYFGMRGEEDAENLANAFVKMQELYEQEFGNAGTSMPAGETAAWCGAAVGEPEQKAGEMAAWCGAAAGKPAQKADETVAWCGAEVGGSQTAAWCGAAAGMPAQKADETVAWCGAAVGKSAQKVEQAAAWCGAAVGKPVQKADETAAWCGAAVGKSAQKVEETVAWCGATVSSPGHAAGETAAWCGAALAMPGQMPAEAAAWCGAAVGKAA